MGRKHHIIKYIIVLIPALYLLMTGKIISLKDITNQFQIFKSKYHINEQNVEYSNNQYITDLQYLKSIYEKTINALKEKI